jgi:tetratricopeptide (TPR) repeat protein
MVHIDSKNPVVKLCIQGTQAEFAGDIEQARALYLKAWELVQNDYEACVAAHYVARHQGDPTEEFRWNQVALNRAKAANDKRIQAFYPSLYLNMGQTYEKLGDQAAAKYFYDLAAELGAFHQSD